MKKEYCVYMHIFPNGKRYIGQTKQKPEYRWNNGNGYIGCPYMDSAIKKYGWNNIEHEVIIDGIDREEANKWEESLIALYRTNEKQFGYNIQSGGSSGYEYTNEIKKKMSEIQKGKKQTDETKQKRSQSLLLYYSTHTVSDEIREKLRNSNLGKSRPLSAEHKKKAIQNIKPHQYKKGHPPNEKAMQLLREKYSKKVIQYDLNGNKIAEYASITEASKLNGLTANAVGNCVRGNVLTTNGFIWKYADETFDISKIDRNKLQRSILAINTPRKIFKMDLDGNIIDEYDSISDAKRITGLYHIGEVLRGKRLTAGGYIWRYADVE